MDKKRRLKVDDSTDQMKEEEENIQLDEDDNPIMHDEYFQNRINTDHL
ncbi:MULTISPECIES: hypothetical protein [Bacillaceae]|uniref:Uncharacterized protein n=1 Tax=Peribacillus huizhouensis TaxID=1501239 RepID=A0ABR6CLN0_9BACI|nr:MULTISPECIES: hypothetical protein [Bacillaceae]MBA9025826.1 hypothetical protein [Peribacillus huizhouensis]